MIFVILFIRCLIFPLHLCIFRIIHIFFVKCYLKAKLENKAIIVNWRIFALKIQSHWYIILLNDEIRRDFLRSYVLFH